METHTQHTKKKQLQLATVMMVIMVPIIVLLAITENHILLGFASAVELLLLGWGAALVKRTSTKSRRRE